MKTSSGSAQLHVQLESGDIMTVQQKGQVENDLLNLKQVEQRQYTGHSLKSLF